MKTRRVLTRSYQITILLCFIMGLLVSILNFKNLLIHTNHTQLQPELLTRQANPPEVSPNQNVSIPTILSRNLFAESPPENSQPASEAPDQRNSKQARFKLLGTIAGAGANSVAIIVDRSKNKQVVASIGQNVTDLGIVESIESKRVRIAVASGDFWLEVGQEDDPLPTDVQLFPAGVDVWIIRKAEIEKLAANPDRVMTAVSFEPRYQGDELTGYEIIRIQQDSLPFRMGLRQGDLVMEVNDRKIRHFDQLLEIYSNMKDLNVITVGFYRVGKKRTFTYEIK